MKYLKNVTLKGLMMATFISLGLTSCSDDDTNPGDGTSNLTVRMTDAPGDYDAVFVDVQDIEIHVDAESETQVETDVDGDGWISVGDVNAGIYDLLELTGGVSQLLADTEVPAGYVSQMRLVLGTENSVVVDGVKKPLNTPSAQQSGLKLQLNQEFIAGENYAFLLDFDVDKSIVTTGNGSYNLKPVIRLSAEANAGAVVGKVVMPVDIQVAVQSLVVLTDGNVTISAYTDADGNFSLNGVPAGIYSLQVIPDADANLNTYAIGTVEVKRNETTDLGELNL
ncbi:DUF4382 domain-containing protein [Christiangramia sabulilitoris]|uniref:DUF4382 domain-containing protein n=1 Tax=Christiangramia sabulilitoris TaxID=2583991 RepID=A0A550I916_9FLAO|nr:DUF4382 domain-containing protein [Christiangramia sabulilitoris]TRO67471.1 DUF4382 domain-containing protein [Christiangramia sabulilitoris]